MSEVGVVVDVVSADVVSGVVGAGVAVSAAVLSAPAVGSVADAMESGFPARLPSAFTFGVFGFGLVLGFAPGRSDRGTRGAFGLRGTRVGAAQPARINRGSGR